MNIGSNANEADRVTGLFVLHFKYRRQFRPNEIELTRAMANQAMLALGHQLGRADDAFPAVQGA
jgi:GAF domain-containing protein